MAQNCRSILRVNVIANNIYCLDGSCTGFHFEAFIYFGTHKILIYGHSGETGRVMEGSPFA